MAMSSTTMNEAESEFLVVTGMSGAGRSTAAAALEDVGWFVIDNLPAGLIMKMAEMVDRPGSGIERVALVIGRGGSNTGSEYFDDLPDVLDALRATRRRVRVVFLDAADDVLVRRYEGTRRRHPLAARGVEESIADERKLLAPVRDRADLLIDTGELNTNQLRCASSRPSATRRRRAMQTSVVSFGYKYGIPLDVDVVFDCRFLPNPFWIEELRPFSGEDEPVRDYVLGQPESQDFLEKVDGLLTGILPAFVREGKSYLTIAWAAPAAAPFGGTGRGAGQAVRRARRPGVGLPPGRRPVSADGGGLGGRRGGAPRWWRSAAGTAPPSPCGRPGATPACSPAWSRWPTTAGAAAGCARSSTWWLWATCASAWSPWPPRTRRWPPPSSTASTRASWPGTRWAT
jgi:UPF0042 nucleotide-binding protein